MFSIYSCTLCVYKFFLSFFVLHPVMKYSMLMFCLYFMSFSSHAILGGPDFLSVTVHTCFLFGLSLTTDWTLHIGKYAINMFRYIVLYQLLMSVNVFQITREFTLHANFQHTYTRVGWEYISCRYINREVESPITNNLNV